MTAAPHLTLLQLSDLQFGRHHRFEGEPGTGSLLDRVLQDLDDLAESEALRPDLVLLTGDLSEWAMDAELDQVRRFAEGLRDKLRLATRRVVMLPGNHDINRKLCEGYFATCEGRGRKPALPYYPKYEPFAEMFARFYTGEPDITFTEKEPWTFFEHPDLRVVVAALNSTIMDSHRTEDHYGFAGEAQIRWFIEKLRPYRERRWLRIAAIHHDILAPESEPAKQDRRDIENMLAPWVSLVLHGHTHEEQVQWLDGKTPVPVLGIGSAGVKVAERPAEVPNQYQIVKVFGDRIEYGRRAYLPDKKRWAGCLRSDPEGKEWKAERKVAFDRVEATFEVGAPQGPAPRTDLAALVEAHRESWAKHESRMGLFDIAARGEDEDVARGIDLLHVFVPPRARREAMARPADPWERGFGDLRDIEDLPARLRGKGKKRGRPAPAPVPFDFGVGGVDSIERLLSSEDLPWLTVLGAPGAGKTALTRWLGLKLCVPGEAPNDAMRDMVPVRIELRQFAELQRCAREAGRAYDFFDHLDDTHRERSMGLRGEPLRSLAETGRLLWLFDGLDEVPDANRRRDLARMIAGVRMKYGGRGVVTSRVAGATPALPALEEAGLVTYTLADFEDEDIEAFIEKWHAGAFPGAPDVADKRKERLRRTLAESRPVRELVKNPLLLTLVALLNRGAELPRRRHLIYEEVVNLMAERWEANKHPSGKAGRLDGVQKKKLLRQVAWRMMTELADGAGNVIHEEDLLETVAAYCERELGEERERARATGQTIIEELRDRNGLLTSLGGRLFGFLHKTLLEYFTAAEVVGRFRAQTWSLEQIKELFRQRWREQEWEEVLWLICGMVQDDRPAYVVELVQAVIEHVGPFDAMGTHLPLAIRCLGEVRDMQQEPVRSMATALTAAATSKSSSWLLDGVISRRVIFLYSTGLISAFRFSGADWPGSQELRSISKGFFGVGSAFIARRLFCGAATVPKGERLQFLKEVAAEPRLRQILPEMVLELGRNGGWRAEEIESILVLTANTKGQIDPDVLATLLAEGALRALPGLISRVEALDLSHLMHGVTVARSLLNAPGGRDAGITLWTRILSAHGMDHWSADELDDLITATKESSELRERVRPLLSARSPISAHELRLATVAWRDEALLDRWTSELFTQEEISTSEADVLLDLARDWPPARGALERISSDLRRIPNEYLRLRFAQLMQERDERCLMHMSEMMHGSKDRRVSVHAASLYAASLLERGHDITAALAQMVAWAKSESREVAEIACFEIGRLALDDIGARQAAFSLARNPNVSGKRRLYTISYLAEALDPEACRLVEELAATAKADGVRFGAARTLERKGAPPTTWRPVLEHLSHFAKTGALRLEAAKALRDERRIEQLSRKAKREEVRRDAAKALEAFRLHNAMLDVGKKRRGRVSMNSVLTGYIEETDTGTRFTYDPAYLSRPGAKALSPTLPLRAEPYESRGVHPFFENLLPEGWLLDITCRKLGMERTDPFGLLLATCSDCAGSVEITADRPDEPANRPARPRRAKKKAAA